MKPINKISLIILLCLFGIIVLIRIIYPPYNILSWDVFGYYLYLPAKFIYNDIGIHDTSWFYKSIETYHQTPGVYQLYPAADGMYLIKYSLGLSVLYSPFFFIAHFYALAFGFSADGFSAPYQYVMVACALFYTLIGLIFLRKILLKYFDDKLTSLLLIIIVLGTNYLNNTTIGGLMSHNFLFTLFAIFIWYTIKWNESGKFKHLLLMAITGGLILISRPNEAVCLIIPILWGVKDFSTLKIKLKFLFKNKYKLCIAFLVFLLVISPQLFYWKAVTGKFIYYSYQNPGEGLDLLNPHTLNFLFSFRKGWFIYTPIVLSAIYGLLYLYKKNKEIFFASVVYLILSVYLVSSWTCWWYAGGCYSQRAIISTYVILAIPLGYFLNEISQKSSLIKWSVYIIIFLMISLNLFQFWQFQKGIISSDRMTKDYYFYVFGRTSVPRGAENYLLIDRFKPFDESQISNYQVKELGSFAFTKSVNSQKEKFIKNPSDANEYCMKMDSTNQYSPSVTITFKDLTNNYYNWIKVSADIYFPEKENDCQPKFVCHFQHKGSVYDYQATDLQSEEICSWKRYSAYFLTPEVRNYSDSLTVYVWHRCAKPVYLKNLLIQALEPKNK